MKKIIAFMLILLLSFSMVFTVVAEEQIVTNADVENPYSTLNLVKQLRENPLVEDVWVPILKDGFHMYSIEVTSNGTYYYQMVNDSGIEVMITIIQNDSLVSLEDERTPYQMYLIENGLPLGTINQEVAKKVSEKNYKLRYRVDDDGVERYVMYLYQNVLHTGVYKGYQAASFVWIQRIKTNHESLSNANLVYDTTLALTPTSMASVMCSYGVSDGILTTENLQDQLAKQTDLTFTTSGDVDGNCKVNAKDALSILKHGVKKKMLTDELALLLADCDNNNTIDAKDALLTLRKAVFK